MKYEDEFLVENHWKVTIFLIIISSTARFTPTRNNSLSEVKHSIKVHSCSFLCYLKIINHSSLEIYFIFEQISSILICMIKIVIHQKRILKTIFIEKADFQWLRVSREFQFFKRCPLSSRIWTWPVLRLFKI